MERFVPTYCSAPDTELLKVLYSKNFTSWITFPDESCFYTALCFALVQHTYPTYSSISCFMERTWKLKVASLRAISDQYGDGYFYYPEYWARFREESQKLMLTVFSHKKHVSDKISAGKMLDPEAKELYEDIAESFRISLALHRTVENAPKTYHYVRGRPESITLFVNLAMEGGKVMTLLHADINNREVSTPTFPFYMLLNSKDRNNPKPIIISREDIPQLQDPRDAIIQNLAKMTKLLARVILAKQTCVARSEESTHEELKAIHRYLAPIIGNCFPESNLDGDELTRVLALPLEAMSRPKHTLSTCVQYHEIPIDIVEHGHSFHVACLEPYLFDLLNREQTPFKCPHHNCEHNLPDSIMDYFPQFKERWQDFKNRVIQAATTSKLSSTCPCCSSSIIAREICTLSCSHRMCVRCYMHWWNMNRCEQCQRWMNNEDYAKLTEFFEKMKNEQKSASVSG